MLDLRPNRELCDVDLAPTADNARICSYECTFCADCVETKLENVCPNCGGGFVPGPVRAANAWRDGSGLAADPADTRRRRLKYSTDEVEALTAKLRDTAPGER